MSTTLKHATLTPVAVFSSGSSLTNNNNAISGTLDPTTTAFGGSGTTPGYELGQFVLKSNSDLGSDPAAGSAYQIYFRQPVDGTLTGTPTTFENDPGRSTNPTQPMAVSRAADPNSTTQNLVFPLVEIPAVPFQVILLNSGTGVALPSGWSLYVTPTTDQGV